MTPLPNPLKEMVDSGILHGNFNDLTPEQQIYHIQTIIKSAKEMNQNHKTDKWFTENNKSVSIETCTKQAHAWLAINLPLINEKLPEPLNTVIIKSLKIPNFHQRSAKEQINIINSLIETTHATEAQLNAMKMINTDTWYIMKDKNNELDCHSIKQIRYQANQWLHSHSPKPDSSWMTIYEDFNSNNTP